MILQFRFYFQTLSSTPNYDLGKIVKNILNRQVNFFSIFYRKF